MIDPCRSEQSTVVTVRARSYRTPESARPASFCLLSRGLSGEKCRGWPHLGGTGVALFAWSGPKSRAECVPIPLRPQGPNTSMTRALAVFAHNEARTIERCLNSLRGVDGTIHVLANGCTDSTEQIV